MNQMFLQNSFGTIQYLPILRKKLDKRKVIRIKWISKDFRCNIERESRQAYPISPLESSYVFHRAFPTPRSLSDHFARSLFLFSSESPCLKPRQYEKAIISHPTVPARPKYHFNYLLSGQNQGRACTVCQSPHGTSIFLNFYCTA